MRKYLLDNKATTVLPAIFFGLSLALLLFCSGNKAAAWYPGSTVGTGYFTNTPSSINTENFLACGINPENNSNYSIVNFVNDIGYYYFGSDSNNPSYHLGYNTQNVNNGGYTLCQNGVPDLVGSPNVDSTGASFYIQSMMDYAPAPPVGQETYSEPSQAGTSPTDPYPPEIAQMPDTNTSAADYIAGEDFHGTWVAFINDVYKAGRINFGENYNWFKNSDYDITNNDDDDWCVKPSSAYPSGCNETDFQTNLSVVIESPSFGQAQFVAEQQCGNVLMGSDVSPQVTPASISISGGVYEKQSDGTLTPLANVEVSYCDNSGPVNNAYTPPGSGTSGIFNFTLYGPGAQGIIPFCIQVDTPPPGGGWAGPYPIPQSGPGYTCTGSSNTTAYENQYAGDEIAGTAPPNCNRPALTGFDFVYTKGAPPTLSCKSLTLSPSSPEPGSNFTVTENYTVGGNASSQPLFSPEASLSTSPGTVSGISSPQSLNGGNPITPPVPSANATFTSLQASVAGSYTFSGSVSGDGGSISSPCPPATLEIGYHPYFQVKGGDISTGTTLGPSSCVTADGAGVYGPDSLSSPTIGSQLAIYALGTISGFASDNGADSGVGLDFANATAPYGNFGNPPCQLNDGTDTTGCSSSASLDVSTLSSSSPAQSCYNVSGPSGLVVYNSNTPSYDVANSVNTTIYVNGNLTVDSNIEYGSWNKASQIPGLTFVVTGNIYFNADSLTLPGNPIINTIYGNYNAPNGTVYTCSDPNNPGTYAQGANCGENNGGATNALSFYGTIVAEKVEFQRTYGNIDTSGGSTKAPAEVFTYGPGVWLSGYSPTNVGDNSYQSITNLPPVL